MTKELWLKLRSQIGRSYSAGPTVAILTVDFFLVTLSLGAAGAGGVLSFGLSELLLVVVFTHLYVIHHELVHGSVFRSRQGNEFAGHLVSLLIALPFLPRRSSHLHHHTWAGNINDPANQRLIARLSSCSPAQLKFLNFLWSVSFPFLVINERIGLWLNGFRQRSGPAPEARRQYYSHLVYCFCYLCLFVLLLVTGSAGFYATWLLPAWCGSLFLEEMANLPHHLDAPLFDSPEPLPLWEQQAVTHSCDTVRVWSRWVLLNFNLHTAHHLFPWVPWHELNRAQETMRRHAPELGSENSDEFSWLLRRRKVPFTEAFRPYSRNDPPA